MRRKIDSFAILALAFGGVSLAGAAILAGNVPGFIIGTLLVLFAGIWAKVTTPKLQTN